MMIMRVMISMRKRNVMRMRIPSSAVKPLVRLQLLFAEGSHPSSSLKSEWVAPEMVMNGMRMATVMKTIMLR